MKISFRNMTMELNVFIVSKQLYAIENFNDDGVVNLIEITINNSFMVFNGDD